MRRRLYDRRQRSHTFEVLADGTDEPIDVNRCGGLLPRARRLYANSATHLADDVAAERAIAFELLFAE
jgi:hypothetical protein